MATAAIPLVLPARSRALLDAAAKALDDDTGAGLRVFLARVCVQQGDAAFVEHHALRAAVAGHKGARAPLEWLATHAARSHVRADALAWIAILDAIPAAPAGSPSGGAAPASTREAKDPAAP